MVKSYSELRKEYDTAYEVYCDESSNTNHVAMKDAEAAYKESEGIKVEGHSGTWYVLDVILHGGKAYRLLEHEQLGEDAPGVIIDENGAVILDDVCEGINELRTILPSILSTKGEEE